MERYNDCDYHPTMNWWSYDIPTMNFESENEFLVFYKKVCDVMGQQENNFSNAVFGQRKLYLDYKSQDQPFDKFFANYKPYLYDFKRGDWTCIGRALEIKELLRSKLVSAYPDIEKCVYVTTSAIGDWQMDTSEYRHICNFMAHSMPSIKCQVNEKTAYVIMEIKKRFDNPILLFENETREFESLSKVRLLCQSRGSQYVEITKTSLKGQLDHLRYAIFVGGALLNVDGVMKLTCLPFIPLYKYRIADGFIQAMIVCYLDKEYFRFTRKLHDAVKGPQFTYKRIPARYFQNTDDAMDEFENEMKEISAIFKEPVEHLKAYLLSASKMNADDKFLRQANEFRTSFVKKRLEYVEHLKCTSSN